MATTRQYLVISDAFKGRLTAWLAHHNIVDIRGGGADTFDKQLAYTTDPTDGSIARAWICCWKMEDDWLEAIRTRAIIEGWAINDPVTPDLSHYKYSDWTEDQVLADTTRKARAMQVVPAPS